MSIDTNRSHLLGGAWSPALFSNLVEKSERELSGNK